MFSLKESILIKQKHLMSFKESTIIKEKVLFSLKDFFIRKYYDIKQVRVIFRKQSNKVTNGVPYIILVCVYV